MTMPAAHLIGRQVLEVDVHGTEADGLALQRLLPGICNLLVTPAVERALDRCDPGDGWVLVERLDVDVGRLALDDLERTLPGAVARAVESFLRHHPPSAPPLSSSPGETAADVVRRRTDRETTDDALVFFLRTGRLPWSLRLPAGRHLEDVLLAAWTATDRPGGPPGPTARAALLDVLARPAARRRLVAQFSPAFRSGLLRLLHPPTAATLDAVLLSVGEVDGSVRAGELFLAALWEAAFAAILSGPSAAPVELLTAAWHAVPPDATGRSSVRSALERHWPGIVRAARPGPRAPAGAPDPAEAVVDGAPVASGRTRPARPVTHVEPTPEEDVAESVYVDDAGVVLLHPFLPLCFEALGIAVGDELIRPERAVCLLHHLATGEVTASEYELVLPKVLCGLAIDEPVPAVTLTAAEIVEAGALLDASIRHWEALRGTGRDALRNTFLVRPGMLSHDEDGAWLLRVEAQTVDILLDQLPWGISMIQLPWMPRLMRVEWR